jgi:4a-hydroxytetrahydrobiopterin dehydratase
VRDRLGLDVDLEVLAVEGGVLAPEQSGQHLGVLVGVPPGVAVVHPVHALDDRLVGRADAEREARAAHGLVHRGGAHELQRRVAGVGLEHGRAELDRLRGPARDGHGGEWVARHRAGIPEAREAVGLGPLCLLDHPVDGSGSTCQSDAHAENLRWEVMARDALLDDDEVATRLAVHPGWQVVDGKLHRELRFADFTEAFAFMTAVAATAEELDHHPDWSNSWNRVVIDITNHDAGGLTARCFALVAAADQAAGTAT